MSMNDINRLSHTSWNCKYHIVFAPKYRRKVFYKEKRAMIEEVELNIEDGRWQSALALALTLPDICGGIAFPEIVKR